MVAVASAVADVVAAPVGVSVGVVSAEAAQPVSPTTMMAPAYATRLTLSTAAPHFAVLHPASTKYADVAPPDTQKFWANP
ncbi:hypothetical protein GCM10010176_081510 [Nonomuraea spiralis]|nr:hypothetical protein GCM10010176_081510 [Nonomuraea spiralis]